MDGFQRRDGAYVAFFDPVEVSLLGDVVETLVEVLGGKPEDEPHDSDEAVLAAAWEAVAGDGFDAGSTAILRRLFPDAYRDDAEASMQFRRYTQGEQRRAKLDAAAVVLCDLANLGTHGMCHIDPSDVDKWLMTLTNTRLVLATQLGIESVEDDDILHTLPEESPEAMLHSVYLWLGWVQESLLGVMV